MDRISNLPDSLQNHIVSFLPLKDAIICSVLSKQWSHVCSSLSNLDFIEIGFRVSRECFKSIVDQILSRHDGSDIRKFCLMVSPFEDEFLSLLHVNTWISFALRHNVQELYMFISSNRPEDLLQAVQPQPQIQFPCAMFTCATLTSLTLVASYKKLKFPPDTRFPVLKKMTLWMISFADEYLTNKFFSDFSCPMLNDLFIRYCKIKNITTLNISFSSLKHFSLYENLSHSYKINLSAPNLLEFVYIGMYPPDIISRTFSSLVSATFKGEGNPYDLDDVSNCPRKILQELRNVETLALLGSFIEFLNRDQYFRSSLPTPYHSLKYLQLGMDAYQNQGHELIFLLRNCPNIQRLSITYHPLKTTCLNMLSLKEYWPCKEFLAGDLLKYLTTVEIQKFQGSRSQLDIVRFLLQSASNLEKMTIIWLDEEHQDLETRTRVFQELLNFTKVSPQVEVLLFTQEGVAYDPK
ncbi:hypothetical protein AQUCO_00500258v1 [Aquilegia coerulea]|nr:hypothetical protein AQUCO_00500258v1 [Aquilegia coerulea]